MASPPLSDSIAFSERRLAAFGIVAIAALFLSGIVSAPFAHAQVSQAAGDAAAPSFEVTSIKKDTEGVIRLGGPDVSRFRAINVTARMLIAFAYATSDLQLIGGPKWIDSDKFDVDARVEDSLAEQLRKLPHIQQQEQLRLMVQSLLADRFALKISHTTKELAIFRLVVAKGGAELASVAPPAPETSVPFPRLPSPGQPTLAPGGTEISLLPGNRASITGKRVPISALAGMLTAMLGRQVVDRTGLKGTYDFVVSYTRDPGLDASALASSQESVPSPSGRNGASLFTALQEQLGLRLESGKGPVDTILVAHIEQPKPN